MAKEKNVRFEQAKDDESTQHLISVNILTTGALVDKNRIISSRCCIGFCERVPKLG